MAVAAKRENKSGFVKEFLSKHPEGNVKAVNEAWTAAGMEGTIGHTVIYKMRSEMGLSGNQAAKSKPRTATKTKPAAKVSKKASSPGKGMFVKEFLNDHPQANVNAVNGAWQAAGFDGSISSALVNKLRASLGLTGNLRGNNKKSKTRKKLETPRKVTASTVNGTPRRNPSTVLEDLEVDIDRLIFKAMAIGNLTEIEETLRQARRLLYRALTRG